jgi:hypothetical protein
MDYYVMVSGIPASGKSTLGRAVAAALEMPILDKDDILEALFKTEGMGNAAWRTRLSRAANEILKERALRLSSAVITSWWRHPASPVDSGTPVDWLSAQPAILVELHCVCSAQVATERFLSRQRHEGHLDGLKTRAEVLASFQQQAALGPLGLGRLVQVNTEVHVELATILAQIELALISDRQTDLC